MAEIDIYSTAMCPYCVAAKNLLHARGLAYREMRIDTDADARRDMLRRAPGARTVPQIFINGHAVGGFSDIHALDRQGRLDTLLFTSTTSLSGEANDN